MSSKKQLARKNSSFDLEQKVNSNLNPCIVKVSNEMNVSLNIQHNLNDKRDLMNSHNISILPKK